jgi:ribose transport system ATP-binding protein
VTGELDRALHVEHLTKTFPGIRALDDVSLSLRRGEIHALLGGNGSGKSTLLTNLAGVLHGDRGPDRGRQAGDLLDRVTSRATVGLRFVHQEHNVFPELSVAGTSRSATDSPPAGPGPSSGGRCSSRAAAVMERFAIDAEPSRPPAPLSPSDRRDGGIARALQDEVRDGHVYVLDEPTAALAPRAQLVYDVLRERRAAGHVLFVSRRRRGRGHRRHRDRVARRSRGRDPCAPSSTATS